MTGTLTTRARCVDATQSSGRSWAWTSSGDSNSRHSWTSDTRTLPVLRMRSPALVAHTDNLPALAAPWWAAASSAISLPETGGQLAAWKSALGVTAEFGQVGVGQPVVLGVVGQPALGLSGLEGTVEQHLQQGMLVVLAPDQRPQTARRGVEGDQGDAGLGWDRPVDAQQGEVSRAASELADDPLQPKVVAAAI